MFQKRKKFTEEVSPEERLSERWDQQIFFITRKFPHADSGITSIKQKYTPAQGEEFVPTEQALNDLANLYSDLQGTIR